MIKIILHGHMGTKFPGNLPDKNWLLGVRTPREAIHAIEANTPGIFQYLVNSATFGVEYRVLLDGKSFCCLEDLYMAREADYETLEIIPEVIGSSSAGIWEVIAGVVLIVVGIILEIPSVGTSTTAVVAGATGLSAGAAAAIVSATATALVGLGLSLALSGIESLIFSSDQASTSKNKPSYLFGGQINTTGQGSAIPVLYGEMIVGSQLISAYLTTIEVNPKTGEPVSAANDENLVDTTIADDDVWGNFLHRTVNGTSTDPYFEVDPTTANMAGGGGGGTGILGDAPKEAQ